MAEFVALLNLDVFDATHMALVIATLLLILMDVVTGIVKGAKSGNINSTKLRSGLWNKLSFVLAIVLSMLCELFINVVDLGVGVPLTTFVCGYIILTELVSNAENLCEINPELCKLFHKFLESTKKQDE